MKEIRLGPNDNSLPSHQTEPTKPIRELTAEEWYKERDSMTDLALKQSQIKTIEELRKEIESLRNEKNNELARLTAPDGAITKRVLIEDNHRLTSEIEQLRKENEELRAKLDRRWIRTADQMPNEQALLLTSSQDIIIGRE